MDNDKVLAEQIHVVFNYLLQQPLFPPANINIDNQSAPSIANYATMMNNQYLEAMGRLQRSSQFASLMTPSFSTTSAGVTAVPQQHQATDPHHEAAATSTALSNQITSNLTGPSPRPLWRNGEKTFPYKVYDMLEFAESSGSTDICSWLPSGDSFVIHDRKLFTEFILPRFFLHKKWRSFVSVLICVVGQLCLC